LAWEWANSENNYAGWNADPWTPSGTDVSRATLDHSEHLGHRPEPSSFGVHDFLVVPPETSWDMPKRPFRANSPMPHPIKRVNECLQLHNPFDVLAIDDELSSRPGVELASPTIPMHYAPSNNICFSPNIFVAPDQTMTSPAAVEKLNQQKPKIGEALKPRRSSRCWRKYSSSGALRKLCTFEIYINKYNITILNTHATFI